MKRFRFFLPIKYPEMVWKWFDPDFCKLPAVLRLAQLLFSLSIFIVIKNIKRIKNNTFFPELVVHKGYFFQT